MIVNGVYEDIPETQVTAQPVKSFFVRMLTRDISLSDAILDLLDNSMDGVIRSLNGGGSGTQPYEGYWADIRFDAKHFSIADNCGGIPWALHDYAFRMGRAAEAEQGRAGSIGTYGIGMKRALFKLGRHSVIQTQHGQHVYEVEVTPDWLDQEDNWTLPVQSLDPVGEDDGTLIRVDELTPDVKALFATGAELFEKELREKIESHYAIIIDKGFSVTLNGKPVRPRPIRLRFDERATGIKPYMFRGRFDGVDVFLSVGFTRPIPSLQEIERENEAEQYSSADAGWTVACNDRVVVYCDRTELTGWGEAGVPKYHTQFIAIAGFVEFRSRNPRKLPMTTTKRGIDASSLLYLKVKNRMREGMRMFTDFTNRWKGRERSAQAQQLIREAPALSVSELKQKSHGVRTTTVRGIGGRQFKPKLPAPKPAEQNSRISFVRPTEEVEVLAEYLQVLPRVPSRVGERCFEIVLGEART